MYDMIAGLLLTRCLRCNEKFAVMLASSSPVLLYSSQYFLTSFFCPLLKPSGRRHSALGTEHGSIAMPATACTQQVMLKHTEAKLSRSQ